MSVRRKQDYKYLLSFSALLVYFLINNEVYLYASSAQLSTRNKNLVSSFHIRKTSH